jgi:hypothetical protein
MKNISTIQNVSLINSTVFLKSDTNQTVINNKMWTEKSGDFISLSSGLMFANNENALFGAFDMNINLGFIASIVYLNMGIYGINTHTNYFGAQITPGLGFNFFRDKIFTFAGMGYFIILPYSGYNVALRVNYNLTEQLSLGLDNKIIFSGSSGDNGNIYSLGANFSYRYNF